MYFETQDEVEQKIRLMSVSACVCIGRERERERCMYVFQLVYVSMYFN